MVVKHPAKVPIAQAVSAFESRCLRHLCASDVIGSHAGLRSLRRKVCVFKSCLVLNKNLSECLEIKLLLRQSEKFTLDQ